MGLPWPIPKGGEWGAPRATGPHRGVDVACPTSTRIYLPVRAKITHAFDPKYYGCILWATWWEGGIKYELMLAHCSKRYHAGETHPAGTLAALSGGAKGAACAGNSTGPHVHVGMRRNGVWTDPTPWLEAIFEPEDEMDKAEVQAIVKAMFGGRTDRLKNLSVAMGNKVVNGSRIVNEVLASEEHRASDHAGGSHEHTGTVTVS